MLRDSILKGSACGHSLTIWAAEIYCQVRALFSQQRNSNRENIKSPPHSLFPSHLSQAFCLLAERRARIKFSSAQTKSCTRSSPGRSGYKYFCHAFFCVAETGQDRKSNRFIPHTFVRAAPKAEEHDFDSLEVSCARCDFLRLSA
jgi:hypothetical protein